MVGLAVRGRVRHVPGHAAGARLLAPVLLALNKPYGVLSQFTPEPGSAWRTLADFGLPVLIDTKLRPEVLKRGDPRFLLTFTTRLLPWRT